MFPSFLRTSFIALAVLAAPGLAHAQSNEEPAAEGEVQQDDGQGKVEQDDGSKARNAAVRKFIDQTRNKMSSMPENELRKRLDRARKFAGADGLPDDLRAELDGLAGELGAEGERRSAETQEQPAQEEVQQSQEQPAQEEEVQQSQEQPVVDESQQQTNVPDDVASFLAGVRPAGELDDDSLRRQARTAQKYAKLGGLPDRIRDELAKIAKASRKEIQRREAAAQSQEGAGQSEDASAEQPSQPQPEIVSQPADAALDANKGNPAAEAKARTFLDDATPAESLSEQALGGRLQAMRDLLAGNELSKDTERKLRRKLAQERKVLRRLVAKEKQMEEKKLGGEATDVPADLAPPEDIFDAGQASAAKRKTYYDNPRIAAVLDDTRPSRVLKVAELRLRIDVLRGAVRDERFLPADRAIWRERLDNDRRVLRLKLMNRREERVVELRRERSNIDIDIGIVFQPDRPVARDVFAAEVDDEELEDVLIAPPRRRIDRRYSVEDIESEPELREAVARIELDTVRFGFGESFLREEEVDALDGIAEVIEKILAVHPREVFLIEGHTDAVGSDASNLKLSRQRALAVKQALSTFYVIPEENLKTVGYGERFLKIPTSEPEAENRRVSVARITPLVGELDE